MQRSADIAAIGCDVIGIMAHEEAYREQVARECVGSVVEAMQTFGDDAFVQMAAVRTMYNMAYRNESGQQAVILADPLPLLHRIFDVYQSDFELVQVCNTPNKHTHVLA